MLPESKPLYLVLVCVNCVAIRHFKPKDNGSNIYRCPVCGLEVSHDSGVVTRLVEVADNPYGRRGRPEVV